MNFQLYAGGKPVQGELLLSKFFSEQTGIFESLRTYEGKIFHLEDHLKRFLESARIAGVDAKIDLKQIRKETLSALEAAQKAKTLKDGDYFLRVTWWQSAVYVMVGQRKHSDTLYRQGVTLKTSPVKRSLFSAVPAAAKTTDYTNSLMAHLEPKSSDVYEWIFLDREGFITEVTIGNFFIVKDGRLQTPPLPGILNGVTRRFVIECAEDLEIPVRETPLTRHEVYNADEAFLTNTSWEILPVRALDGRKIGSQIPGPLTLKLQQTFKKKALQACR